MGLRVEEEQAMPPAQRIAVLQAEIDARLAALRGGADPGKHIGNIKWCAAAMWALDYPGEGVTPAGLLAPEDIER